MNRPFATGLAFMGTVVLLCGCASSAPSKFYTLTAVPAGGAAPAPVQPSLPVRVVAVRIPPMLDRQEIARPSAGDQLVISGEERWDAPLDEMIQEILTRDLIERLPASAVILPGAPAPARVDSIVVNILQFQSDVAGKVLFQGSWSLLTPGTAAPSLIRDFRYSAEASPESTGEEVQAMSTLLGELADDIARSLPAH
jgi:uncharacterized protein